MGAILREVGWGSIDDIVQVRHRRRADATRRKWLMSRSSIEQGCTVLNLPEGRALPVDIPSFLEEEELQTACPRDPDAPPSPPRRATRIPKALRHLWNLVKEEVPAVAYPRMELEGDANAQVTKFMIHQLSDMISDGTLVQLNEHDRHNELIDPATSMPLAWAMYAEAAKKTDDEYLAWMTNLARCHCNDERGNVFVACYACQDRTHLQCFRLSIYDKERMREGACDHQQSIGLPWRCSRCRREIDGDNSVEEDVMPDSSQYPIPEDLRNSMAEVIAGMFHSTEAVPPNYANLPNKAQIEDGDDEKIRSESGSIPWKPDVYRCFGTNRFDRDGNSLNGDGGGGCRGDVPASVARDGGRQSVVKTVQPPDSPTSVQPPDASVSLNSAHQAASFTSATRGAAGEEESHLAMTPHP